MLTLPFNIASYAILNILLAKAANLDPGELIFCGGDTHIYLNHIDQAKEQLKRKPYAFPKLKINKDISSIKDIENLTFEDFNITNYISHSSIKASIAI